MLTKPILIKLNAEKPTDCKQAEYCWAAVTTERIGLQNGVCDSLNITGIKNRKKAAEMTASFSFVNEKSNNFADVTFDALVKLGVIKPVLIDSNAEMPTRRNQEVLDRERLSEWALKVMSEAIVRALGNNNLERSAEMTDPLLLN